MMLSRTEKARPDEDSCRVRRNKNGAYSARANNGDLILSLEYLRDEGFVGVRMDMFEEGDFRVVLELTSKERMYILHEEGRRGLSMYRCPELKVYLINGGVAAQLTNLMNAKNVPLAIHDKFRRKLYNRARLLVAAAEIEKYNLTAFLQYTCRVKYNVNSSNTISGPMPAIVRF